MAPPLWVGDDFIGMSGNPVDGFVGYILNATWADGPDGRAVVHLYGVLQDGRPFLVRDGRDPPCFYVESADRERASRAGAPRPAPTRLRTLYGAPAHRVELTHPRRAPALRNRLHRAGVRTYQADVRFAYRYLIDRGIRSAVRIHGRPRSVLADWPRTAVFDEPSLAPADWTPELTTLSIDLETDPQARRIYSVALWGCGAQEVLLWRPDRTARAACPAGAVPCADEAELLTVLCRRIRELDPDVLTGWNIIDFDVPVLLRRAAAAGVTLELGRAPGALRQRNGGARRAGDSVFIAGRTVLDGIRLLRAVGLRLPSYGLETAARHVLGRGKAFTADDHAAEIQRCFAQDPERFVHYNLTDARLAYDILEKLKLVPFTVHRSLLTGLPPDRAGASIAAFDFLYLSRLRERGVVAPTVGVTHGDDAAQRSGQHGGHVLPSQPGLHDGVLVFDFKSLYPSIIRTFQIDPLGLIREPAPHGADGAIRAPNGARFHRRRGILSALLDDLFASREQAERDGDAVAANAIKLLMNSFYGVLGTPSCRFHDLRLANAVTGFGKHFLLWAKTWMERRGLRVLYGDTDSLFVAAGADAARSRGERLAAELTADLARYVADTWRVRSALLLEFETLFDRLFLPPLRSGQRGATKRYVGRSDGRLRFTGMEVVRSDWTDLAHEVQRELYGRLFAGDPVEEYLRQMIGEVAAGRRDRQLVYRKALRKGVREYRALPPHVAAARKQAAPAAKEMRGVIDYVITVEGPEPAGGRRSPIDYEHYVERQIRPVAEPVLGVLQRNFDEVRRNQRQLELFPARSGRGAAPGGATGRPPSAA